MRTAHFLSWGRMHHFPQLVLNEETGEVLRAGEQAWQVLVTAGSKRRLQRAKRRVKKWQEYLCLTEKKEVAA